MSTHKDVSPNVNYSNDITQTFWGQVACYISNIFSPPLVVIYGILISTYYLDTSSRWVWATLFIMLFVLPPTLYVVSLLKKGQIKDFHMNIRGERVKPLLVILLNTFVGVGIFTFLSISLSVLVSPEIYGNLLNKVIPISCELLISLAFNVHFDLPV